MRNGNAQELKSPLRLSIVTQFYPPDYAATGQLLEELVNLLAAHGTQVQVFTGQPGYAFKKQDAPAVEQTSQVLIRRSRTARLWPQRIRGKALNGLLFCFRSAIHLLKASFRGNLLLVTTAPPYLPVLGLLANRLFKVRYICLLYDVYPDVAVELNVVQADHWVTRLWNFFNRQIWHHAEAIVVLSSSMKDRIINHAPEIANKVNVIHSWADPNWIVPIPKQDNWFAKEHHLAEQFSVLYSGNMGRCHDMDTILDAAQQLRDEAIRFVFIGSGAKRASVIQQAEERGLTNCLFLPYQDKETLPYSLTACDLSLVSIGPGMEGLIAPSKFYGCLAAGRPIAAICDSSSYLRTIIEEANCGATFNTGDGKGLAQFIRHLSKNTHLVERMGRAGRRYHETYFTPDIIARQYLKLFMGVVQETNAESELTKEVGSDLLSQAMAHKQLQSSAASPRVP